MPADGSVISENLSDSTRAGQQADLAFAASPLGQTYLRRQHVAYPFHICRPFMVEGDPAGMASLYLQSCAGGIFEHDRLSLNVSMDAGSKVHLTTPASTIVHTMTGGSGALTSVFRVGENAWLEMVSDPVILFPSSTFVSATQLTVHPTGLAVLSDCFLLHDPLGEARPFASLISDTSIAIEGRGRVARDRYSVSGTVVSAGIPGITGDYRVQGTFLAVAPDGRLLPFEADLREALSEVGGIYAGVSQLPGDAGLWCRVLAADPVALRKALDGLWSTLRTRLTGRSPRPRRK